jgi:hypothetical protein
MLVSGHVVVNAPAGIGTGTDPTPPGQFFVAFYEQFPWTRVRTLQRTRTPSPTGKAPVTP